MRRITGVRALAIGFAAALLAAGGCGKTSDVTGVGAAAQQAADVIAVEAGAAASVDNGGLMLELAGTSSAVPMSVVPVSSDAALAPDTAFARGGLTISLTRTFYDVNSNALPQWDPSAVRALITSWIRGTVTGLRYHATMGRTGSLNVNGLAAALDTLIFDGTATDTTDAVYTSLDGNRTVDAHVLATRVLTGVRKLKNIGLDPWPLSGTATWNFSIDKYATGSPGTIEAHYDAVVVVTFNGTEIADAAVNSRFHYRIDLQTGVVTRA